MIVRDEADRIVRCLESCRELIDYWVICDTGSVDETPALVERALAGVPGELHHHEWVDFGHNRSGLMELAHGKADYLLLLDADWTVEVEPGALEGLTADAYMVPHPGDTVFHNKRLVSGRIPWRYEGATHEYITSPQERTCELLDGLKIHVESVGGVRTGRFKRDLELLTAAIERDANDARAVFYLAQTYRDMGEHKQAILNYERRARMGGWEEEVFYSLFQVGVLSAEAGDWPAGLTALIAAFEHRPARIEPLYELASRLRVRGDYETAHVFASRGLNRPMPADLLFVQPWIYRWGLLFEYSISAYWTGDTRRALAACDRLLTISELPEVYRKQTLENRGHCVRRLAAKRARTGVSPHSPTAPGRAQRER
jgi:tetratricopeptide (TPR) repeat protein